MKKLRTAVLSSLALAGAGMPCRGDVTFRAAAGEGVVLTAVQPRVFSPNEASAQVNRVRFTFNNPDGYEVTVRIFDVSGRLIRPNIDREGETVLFWDGRDSDGTVVPSGIYIYQMDAGVKILNGAIVVAR